MAFHLDGRQDLDDNYRGRSNLFAEINMTPFVDVCLVLLIIFMVTAPFAVSGVNVKLPETQAKSLSMSNDSLILSISKHGEFYLGKYPVKGNNLIEKIKAAIMTKNGNQKSPLFIRADKDVPYGKVMEAMASAQRAGVDKIGMIGENKNEKRR